MGKQRMQISLDMIMSTFLSMLVILFFLFSILSAYHILIAKSSEASSAIGKVIRNCNFASLVGVGC